MVNLGRRSVLITISVVIAIAVIVVLCLYYIPVQNEINYTFDRISPLLEAIAPQEKKHSIR